MPDATVGPLASTGSPATGSTAPVSSATGSSAAGSPAPPRPSPPPAAQPRPRRRWWPTLLGIWLLSLVSVWGFMAARASSLAYAHDRLQLTQAWTHARMRVLEAETELHASNLGRAMAALRDAERPLRQVRTTLEALDRLDVAPGLAEAESKLAIATTLVERQDGAAADHTRSIVQALDDVLAAASGAFAFGDANASSR